MKCRKCKDKAVINMRQHKLALCKPHYLEWFTEQTERFIKKYQMFHRDDRVLVAVSGGKDSLVLWDVLHKLGYQADGLYIGLGIDGGIGYSDNSYQAIQKFLEVRPELNLEMVDVKSLYGADIPTAALQTYRGREKSCSICGLTKRHIMNRIAFEGGYTVLATGHNLDDEAAVLFGNTLNWLGDYLLRQGPVLPAYSGLAKKVKPFFRFYERETAAYALLTGIEYVYDECPFAEGAKSIIYKQYLNQLEADRPGAKLQFYLRFLAAKEDGLFREDENIALLENCISCGQPTMAAGHCSFCRMWEQVQERLAQSV